MCDARRPRTKVVTVLEGQKQASIYRLWYNTRFVLPKEGICSARLMGIVAGLGLLWRALAPAWSVRDVPHCRISVYETSPPQRGGGDGTGARCGCWT